ncbi:UNVERIFIED_CONTAM: hypothetical protein B566_EDAN017737, partial [Ephemera danica]
MFCLRLTTALVFLVTLVTSHPRAFLGKEPEKLLSIEPRATLLDYQLPGNVVPETYEVWLIPYLNDVDKNKAFTFTGKVKIRINVKTATKLIRMHANDLTIIDPPTLTRAPGDPGDPVPDYENNVLSADDKHFLDINYKNNIPVGNYDLVINFKGKVNDELEGFYRSTYVDKTGLQKWLAVTQFESTGARRAFPCWDEPKWKAKFNIRIAYDPSKYKVRGNMIGEDSPTPDPGLPKDWKWMVFGETPKMSTYLVAFTVNEFSNSQIVTGTNIADIHTYAVWARPEAIESSQAKVANDIAPLIDDYMKTYTRNSHPLLRKTDQIAIPDFDAGAMENWGMITYREILLLFEEGVSTNWDRQLVEQVVTHELAHQWFGNLVTPVWWDLIWLNEGFATYFEYHALAQIRTNWQLERQFILEETHPVMQSDALATSHAMLVPDVVTPADANGVFNSIAYNKAASIIRMLEQLIGSVNFKEGIRQYISDREYDTATMTDLWTALDAHIDAGVFDAPLATVMESWTKKPGYPVLNIVRDNNIMHLNQDRFLTKPNDTLSTETKWYIPVTYTTEAEPDFKQRKVTWLSCREDVITLKKYLNETQWYIVNLQQIGFYRVNYDDNNWQVLTEALNDDKRRSKIDVINRAQLVDDVLALARANYTHYDVALTVTTYLQNELEYMPWAASLAAMNYLYDRLNNDTDSLALFQEYMLGLMESVYESVEGFTIVDDDSHMTRIKRTLILKFQCIKKGGQEEYDYLFYRYGNATNVASEQVIILSALGCASDEELLEAYLNESIAEPSRIRNQDARRVITAVYNNPIGVNLALDFMLLNWNTTTELYNGVGSTGSVMSGLSKKLNTQEQRDKLQDFLDTNRPTLSETDIKSLTNAIGVVDETLEWHENYRGIVVSWLESRQGPPITDKPPTNKSPTSMLFCPSLLLATI